MKRRQKKYARAGFTFIEMMVALIIMAILSIAVCTMTFGAMNVDRYSRSVGQTQSEIELATHRLINNLRSAQTGTITTGTSTCHSTTQSDAANGYSSGATVSYALATDATIATQKNLVETDQRFGTNILVHNVTTFTVTPDATIDGLYQVDLVVAGSMIEERHFKVFNRN